MKWGALSKFVERTVFWAVSIVGIYLVNMKMLAFSFPLSVALAVAAVWFLMKDIKPRLFPSSIQMNYMREGLVIGFSGIAASLCLTIDQFMITHYMGAYELGLYSAATKAFFAILTFLWVYSYALFPRLSQSSVDQEGTRRLLVKHTIGLGIWGTAAVGILCLFADPLIRLFFSEKFLVISPIFKILTFFMVVSFFNVLFSDGLNAFNKQTVRLYIVLGALALNIVLNLFFIPTLGLLGAVYASIIAQLLILLLSYFQVKKIFQLKVGWVISGFLMASLALVKLSFVL
jgi:O-antigen/teichoic acid export membrane protein